MSLDVVTPAPDPYLTTTQAVKDALGLSTSTSSSLNAKIDGLILRASAWADRIVGYPLAAAGYRETVPGYGGRNLMLSRTPIRSVQAVYYGTDTGEALALYSSEFGVETEEGFLSRATGFEWSVPVLPFLSEAAAMPAAGQEYRPWLADYVAGFSYEGISTGSPLWSTEKGTTSTGRTLPHDIEGAVIDKVTRLYGGKDDVSEKAIGDLRIKFASGDTLPAWARNDPAALPLGRWRRLA